MKSIRNIVAVFYVLAAWCTVAVSAQQANHNEAQPASVLANNAEFILTAIDESAVAQFKNAWRSVGSGTDKIEAVVLLYRKIDGSLESTLLPLTNEIERFGFSWNAAIIGVVHTHPNRDDFRPSHQDLKVSNRFNVPIFTITSRGMYMYDPEKKKISRVQPDLNWLNYSKVEFRFSTCIAQMMLIFSLRDRVD
jgi:hypothetical protein